jgi:hypothetical protein
MIITELGDKFVLIKWERFKRYISLHKKYIKIFFLELISEFGTLLTNHFNNQIPIYEKILYSNSLVSLEFSQRLHRLPVGNEI